MPKSFAGLFMAAIASVVTVALGVAILTRTPLWKYIVGAPRA